MESMASRNIKNCNQFLKTNTPSSLPSSPSSTTTTTTNNNNNNPSSLSTSRSPLSVMSASTTTTTTTTTTMTLKTTSRKQQRRLHLGAASVLLLPLLLLLLVLLVLPEGCVGYPQGADPSSCTTMEPRHGSNTPSGQLSPYVVLVSKSSYKPGDSISVMLRGLCGTQFLGFLAQGRRADPADPRYRANPSQAIGSFQAVAGTQYLCGEGGVALTHDARYGGTTILFNWTAPSQPEGHVQIKASFVKNFSSMWTSVASVVIQDPQATPISVDPDSLRTDFIEPCEIDRPKPRPTVPPPTTPAPVTTPSPTTPAVTTPSTPPVIPTPLPSVDNSGPVVTSPPRVAEMSTQASLVEIQRTTTNPVLPPLPVIKCGETHGCFRQCSSSSSNLCDFRVAWQARQDTVWFDVMVPPLDHADQQWLALAFSDDHKMGQDSVVECLTDKDTVTSHLSFNGDHDNSILPSDKTRGMVSEVRVSTEDGYLHCQFTRRMNMSNARAQEMEGEEGEETERRVYDLEQDWFLLLAQGSVRDGRKERHADIPVVSARLVDLQSLDVVGVWVQDKVLIKLHASLMSFAWIFCASFGIIMARYSKPLWPKHLLCGRKVWFTIHRVCMVSLGVLTLLGFIIIFVQAGGLSDISAREFQKLHPIVGMVVTVFTAVQIAFGIFRPSSTSKNRPVYNWGHWMLGFASHILSVFNIGLGLQLRKAGTHASAAYVLYAYAIYEICMIIALEVISLNIRIKENKTASYVIYERRNTIYASTKEIMEGNSNEPPGSIALRIAIRVHLLFVTAFTAALVALIAIA